MELITCELKEGFTDPETGTVHKHVLMHRATAREDIAIHVDPRLAQLQLGNSWNSTDPVEMAIGAANWRIYNTIVLEQIVEQIGDLKRADIVKKKIVGELSPRDIILMTSALRGGGEEREPELPVSIIKEVIDASVADDDLRRKIKKALADKLGETTAMTSP